MALLAKSAEFDGMERYCSPWQIIMPAGQCVDVVRVASRDNLLLEELFCKDLGLL